MDDCIPHRNHNGKHSLRLLSVLHLYRNAVGPVATLKNSVWTWIRPTKRWQTIHQWAASTHRLDRSQRCCCCSNYNMANDANGGYRSFPQHTAKKNLLVIYWTLWPNRNGAEDWAIILKYYLSVQMWWPAMHSPCPMSSLPCSVHHCRPLPAIGLQHVLTVVNERVCWPMRFVRRHSLRRVTWKTGVRTWTQLHRSQPNCRMDVIFGRCWIQLHSYVAILHHRWKHFLNRSD